MLGTVRDASNAVVPDASVTLTNTATGVSSIRTTNAEGKYECFVWSLPVGRGKRWMGDASRALDLLVGGWQFAGISSFYSGEPVTFTYTPPAAALVSGITQDFRGQNIFRPNLAGDPSPAKGQQSITNWFNRDAVVIPAELDAEGLDVRFTIVGEGREREWLRQRMLRAQFTGVLRGEALADAYAQMDIFAFPSETDTVGNVVLEAMASGVTSVVMAHGGQRFIVDPERTAIVADTHDAFVQGVRTLVKNRRRREAMGIAARALAVELLSWDRIFIDICNAYEIAISSAEGEGHNGCVLSPA